ncbi:MAG: NADH-quinone oxidoreductase subunit C [Dehalococcoidales bacterium]|nr:NADH-quinone oxidoreductase subunit C [Dehalococcoidales bacterium]
MTVVLAGADIAAKLAPKFTESIIEAQENSLLVKSSGIRDILAFLKNEPGLEFDYLTDMTATDYWEYFEVVYQLISIKNNQKSTVKTRFEGRENVVLPSVVDIYKGADYQEREIFDLLGIKFEGHPNLKRIVLWEGFQGYPLRKDYL